MGNTQHEPVRNYSTFEDHRQCLRDDDSAPPTLAHVAAKILAGDIDQIIVLAGAGISVSAGIPDFRSPGSGLYDNLGKYNLPYPEAIFDLDFFDQNPYPFFRLAGELFPGKFRPTPTHYFLTLLAQKGLLRRVFTQNIDTLESVAGLPESKYVACHGNFSSATCRTCQREYSQAWMESKLFGEGAANHTPAPAPAPAQDNNLFRNAFHGLVKPRHEEDEEESLPVLPRCETCNGIVKPNITFFGEALPSRFEKCAVPDVQRCDLLLVMGTSLNVYPVGQLPDQVGPWVPRVLFNREPVHIANKFKVSEMLRRHAEEEAARQTEEQAEEQGGIMDTGLGAAREEDPDLYTGLPVDDEEEEVVDTGFWFELGQDVGEDGTTRSCNYRDVFAKGNCDDTVQEFVKLLGWTEEFEMLCREGNERFEAMKRASEEVVAKDDLAEGKEDRKDGVD
jgi:NAD-dependent SIR2 family protein deacetylase